MLSGWTRRLTRLNNAAAHGLGLLGLAVGRSPKRTAAIAVVMAALCCAGWTNVEFETDSAVLWRPKDSTVEAEKERAIEIGASRQAFEASNGKNGWGGHVTLQRADGGSVTTKAGLVKLMELWAVSIQTGAGAQFCDAYAQASIFGYFKNTEAVANPTNTAAVAAQHVCPTSSDFAAVEAVIGAMTDAAVEAKLLSLLLTEVVADADGRVPMAQFSARRTHRYLIGTPTCGSGSCAATAPATGAAAMRFFVKGMNEWDTAKFEDWVDGLVAGSDGIWTVTVEHRSSSGKEMGATMAEATVPIIVGYLLMVVWVSVTMGGTHSVTGMVLVGLGSVGTIFLSVAAGFGVASACGVVLNVLSPVLPILLLGIGVDDGFVLVNTYSSLDPALAVTDRIEHTLREAGLAVVMTSLTDIVAFGAGTTANLTAISEFCALAAICVAADFVLQITLFIAIVVLDRMRASKNKLWCCCITSSADPKEVPARDPGSGDARTANPKLMARFVEPLLLSGPIRQGVVLVAFMVIVAFLGRGIGKVEIGSGSYMYAPTDSYYPKSIAVTEEHFAPADGDPFTVVATQLDTISTIEGQEGILGILSALANSDHINAGWGTQCWLREFVEVWLPANYASCGATSVAIGRTTGFFACAAAFRADAETNYTAGIDAGVLPFFGANGTAVNIPWHRDFFITQSGSQIGASMCWARHPRSYPESDGYDYAMKVEEIRALVADRGDAYGAFAFNNDYLNLARFVSMEETAMTTLIAAAVSCFLVTLFFMISPTVTFIVTLMVVLIDVCIFGVMGYTGIYLGEPSIVCLVMACGFSIDFSSHVAHTFMHISAPTGNERAAQALALSAGAVMNAGFTTLIAGVCMLLGGNLFKIFGQMFIIIILAGQAFALILLPIILSKLSWVAVTGHDDAAEVVITDAIKPTVEAPELVAEAAPPAFEPSLVIADKDGETLRMQSVHRSNPIHDGSGADQPGLPYAL